jgi:acetylornithine deacetylase/succinyl-diaminopimelate desuccinylase
MKTLVKLIQSLVRIPGHRDLPEKEGNVARYIEEWLRNANLCVRTENVLPNRPNVIATINGSGDGNNLLYSGHMDTVPEYGWEGDPGPFSGKILGNKVYGRGACDMKGALAAIMVAMDAIQKSGIKLRGNLIFSGVIGEEGEGSIGTKDFVQRTHVNVAETAVVCEPSNLQIFIGHKGFSNLRISTRGRSVHSAYPKKGVNAIELMCDVLQTLRKELYPKLKSRKHKLLGPPVLTITLIKGGTLADTVPDSCEALVNYRYPPGEDPSKVEEEIVYLLGKMQEENTNLDAKVTILSNVLGMKTSKQSGIVKSLKQNVEEVTGITPKITGTGYWTDASIFTNNGKMQSVIFGPGDEMLAHTTQENIDINQLLIASQVYALTALDICE